MRFIKLGSVLIITILFVSGCFVSTSDYDKETIEKAEATAKSYLENNYTDIKSVEIVKVYRGEMGGMEVTGTVNNKHTFSMGVEVSNFTIGSIGEGEGFPELKEECREKDCDY
ncbi:MAG TPA: hypothetical protein VK144_04250 [Bacillota bacterium]|nr:hypothetical protein [Bacillota bacterium]